MGQEYLGIIGNGETCALISPLGGIDWFCLPRFDGDLIFAKALDPINGESLTMHYMEKGKELAFMSAKQRYLPRTNILQTILEYKGLLITVTDVMPWGERAIARKITLKNTNHHARSIDLVLKTRKPAGEDLYHREIGSDEMLTSNEHYAVGLAIPKERKVRIKPGEEKTLSVVLCYDVSVPRVQALMESWHHRDINEVIRASEDFWQSWLDRGRPMHITGTDIEVIERGLLCMKLLQHTSGACIAAPTASFPAYPGLNDNWDYRFCWIRDTYFTGRAFLLAGHFDEVQASLRFLLSLQGKDGHWEQPFYTIDGQLPPKEIVMENLRGPNREINIRINNGARDQLQLDSEGSVLHLLYLYMLFSKEVEFGRQHWKQVVKAADWIAKNYKQPEHGIWEFRERRMQWTYGKVLCYVGLESACKIADMLSMQRKSSWTQTKERLRKEILKESWSTQRGAYLQTYEEDAPLDISVLALEDYGLVQANSQRMKSTVKRFEERLVFQGGVKRFEGAVLPFFLPTLWLASHYIKANDRAKARKLLDHAIANTTVLHLAAEHYDPRTGSQHGNYPQLFCMSMFVEQLLLYHHKPSLMINFQLLDLPLRKTTEIVDEVLISPLRKIFS